MRFSNISAQQWKSMSDWNLLPTPPHTLRLGNALTPFVLCEQALGYLWLKSACVKGKWFAYQLSTECFKQQAHLFLHWCGEDCHTQLRICASAATVGRSHPTFWFLFHLSPLQLAHLLTSLIAECFPVWTCAWVFLGTINYAINSADEKQCQTFLVQTVFGTLDLLVLVIKFLWQQNSFSYERWLVNISPVDWLHSKPNILKLLNINKNTSNKNHSENVLGSFDFHERRWQCSCEHSVPWLYRQTF